MRKPTPAFLAASMAIALACTAAQGQMNSASRGTPASATTTTTTSNSPGTLGASGTTAGTSISGTSSGDAFTGSSRGNAPPVGPAAGSSATFTNNPSATGGIFNANGERIAPFIVNPDTGALMNGPVTYGTAIGSGDNASNASANATGASADTRVGAAASTSELDQATRREAQHQRRTVERKGQMMQSIAPRSNVDRTDQMPDDSTPLLSPSRR
jgi:hypothetical protein